MGKVGGAENVAASFLCGELKFGEANSWVTITSGTLDRSVRFVCEVSGLETPSR